MYNATDLNLSSFLTLVYLAHQKLILKLRNTETFFNQSDCFWPKNPITNTSCDYCQWIFIFYKSKCLCDNLVNKKEKSNDNQLSPFGLIETVMCQTHWKWPVNQLVLTGQNICERSIFQTFWKANSCTDSLFLELETSNFGYLLIFCFSLTVQSFSKIEKLWY